MEVEYETCFLLGSGIVLCGSRNYVIRISFRVQSIEFPIPRRPLCTLIVADNTILATVYLSTVARNIAFSNDLARLLVAVAFETFLLPYVCDCVRLRLNINCFFIVGSNLFLSLSIYIFFFFLLVEYGLEFDLHSVFDKSSINNRKNIRWKPHQVQLHTGQKAKKEQEIFKNNSIDDE